MILVTGGTGAIGTPLVRGLVAKGNKIRVLTLPKDPFVGRLKDLVDAGSVEIVYGDVSDLESLKGKFDGVKTIYHLAAVLLAADPSIYEKVNVGGTRNMIQMGLECGAEHFILVSSASITYPIPTPYSLSKRKKEALIKEQTKMKWTIVRPTLAYSNIGGEEFNMLKDHCLSRKWFIPFIGSGKSLKRPVHTDDLMAGFLAIPNNPASYNKEYNFSGGEDITLRDLAKLILKHHGRSTPIIGIPVWLCHVIGFFQKLFSKKPKMNWGAIAGFIYDANLDNSNARADLDYNPIGIHEGMQKCFPLPAAAGAPAAARS
jgi:NADH dehydrogenase